MVNLLKMDFRRLSRSKFLIISLSIIAFLNIVLNILITVLTNAIKNSEIFEDTDITFTQPTLSDGITNPFYMGILIILMYISLTGFSYADISHGFIKNIAGQLPKRSYSVISKFIVVGVHNFIYIIVGSITTTIGYILLNIMGQIDLNMNVSVLADIGTILLKWLLSMAIASLILFFTTGIRNKTLGIVFGVVMGIGALGLIYLAVNTGAANIFHVEGFDLSMYMPDTLYDIVNVASGTGVVNALVVSAVWIALFMYLTILLFNRRDIS